MAVSLYHNTRLGPMSSVVDSSYLFFKRFVTLFGIIRTNNNISMSEDDSVQTFGCFIITVCV